MAVIFSPKHLQNCHTFIQWHYLPILCQATSAMPDIQTSVKSTDKPAPEDLPSTTPESRLIALVEQNVRSTVGGVNPGKNTQPGLDDACTLV